MLTVYDENKNVKYCSKTVCANKNQGKSVCCREVLSRMHGPDKLWLDLVKETAEMVTKEREKRGAPDKPILKETEEYKREFEAKKQAL